ncbi:MAG TPA: hypothetical protein DE015_04555, partial [Oceanospirillales bacterium]|nr:hypothetical protein [Oceanospirillales bacterium]
MLFTQVTRCPHCQTSFRVGDEQLEAANGFVRCGSCLQVFNATDYFVGEREGAQNAAESEDAATETVSDIVSEDAVDTTTEEKPAPQSFAFTFADDEPEPEP